MQPDANLACDPAKLQILMNGLSACHGCLYISETSCEQFNRYLDRSLVVSTIERLGCEFFTLPA